MSKKIKILIFASGVLLTILIFFFVYKFFIQADTAKTVTIAGNIYQGLSDEASTTPAANCQVSIANPYDDKEEASGITDANGRFILTVKNPARYPYRLIAGGGEYSTRVVDKLTLDPLQPGADGNLPYQNLKYNVDKQIQLMWSSVFSHSYTEGYSDDNLYRISQYDTHYLKNLVPSRENYVDPIVPDKAQFKIKIKDVIDLTSSGSTATTLPIKATVSVMPVRSYWAGLKQTSLGPVVAKQDISIDQSLAGQELAFDIDLTQLSGSDRFYALTNGFAVNMTLAPEFAGTNPILRIDKISSTDNQISYQGEQKLRDFELGTATCSRSGCNCSKLKGIATIDFLGRELSINERAKDAFTKVATEIKAAGLDLSYNIYNPSCGFKDGGGFVCRKITNGNIPSNHAFGTAVDLNPGCNGNSKNDDGSCVTNFPPEIVTIFKNNNFLWGGDYLGYCDAMHFEWYGWAPWETY